MASSSTTGTNKVSLGTNMSHILLIEEYMETRAFNDKFDIRSFSDKDFYAALSESAHGAAREVVDSMNMKVDCRKGKPLPDKRTAFGPTSSPVLREMGTEQIRQVFRTALAIRTYAENDVRVRHLFRFIFRNFAVPHNTIVASAFLQTAAMKKKNKRDVQSYEIKVPTTFEAFLYLYCLNFTRLITLRRKLHSGPHLSPFHQQTNQRPTYQLLQQPKHTNSIMDDESDIIQTRNQLSTPRRKELLRTAKKSRTLNQSDVVRAEKTMTEKSDSKVAFLEVKSASKFEEVQNVLEKQSKSMKAELGNASDCEKLEQLKIKLDRLVEHTKKV